MRDITTTDLSEFGYREIEIVRDLLDKWVNDSLPEDFEYDGVTVMFNTSSGNVFLTNSEYQVAMINPDTDKLESFYITPYEGREGFITDLVKEYEGMHPEDQEYIRDIVENYYPEIELPEVV